MRQQLLTSVITNIPASVSVGNNTLQVMGGLATVKAVGKAATTSVPDVEEALLVADQLPLVFEALRGKRHLPRGWRMAA